MDVKIGDKVRIKTEEELLASGYIKYNYYYENKNKDFVYEYELGEIVMLVEYDNKTEWFRYQEIGSSKFESIPKSAIAEVISQTLDEYICSLPLEERAKWFIEEIFIRLDDDVGSLNTNYHSILTNHNYFTYDEALEATIKALKQNKEN